MMSQMSPDSPLTFFQNYHTRKAQFKSGIDPSCSRKNRAQTNLQIRKLKRFESLLKRRHHYDVNQAPLSESIHQNIMMEQSDINDVNDLQEKDLLRRYIDDLHDSDSYVILAATRGISRSIVREDRSRVYDIIRSSSTSLIVDLVTLMRHEDTLIVTEALWILTNIMSEEIIDNSVPTVMNCGIMNDLKRLMKHRKGKIRNAALSLLGNMAGDSPTTRDLLLTDSHVVHSLIEIVTEAHDQDTFDLVSFTIYNLFRDHDQQYPSFRNSKELIPLLMCLISNAQWYTMESSLEPNTLVYSCASLLLFTEAEDDRIDRIQSILDCGIMTGIITLLQHVREDIVWYAIKILTNMSCSSKEHLRSILESGVIHHIKSKLSHISSDVRKSACIFVSKIAVGSSDHICHLMHDDQSILPVVIEVAKTDQYSVKIQACRVLINLCQNKEMTFGQIECLVRMGGLDALSSIFVHDMDISTLLSAIDALECVLVLGKSAGTGYFRTVLEECDGMDRLESLQFHKNPDVFAKVSIFLERYYKDDDDDIEPDDDMEYNLETEEVPFQLEAKSGESVAFAFAS